MSNYIMQPAVAGTCVCMFTGKPHDYIFVGAEWNRAYQDFLGDCYEKSLHTDSDDYQTIFLRTQTGKIRPASTGDVIMKDEKGFFVVTEDYFFSNFRT